MTLSPKRRTSAVRNLALATVALIALASPRTALANPSIWMQCDGIAKPESAAASAARTAGAILLSSVVIGVFLLPEENPTGRPAASGPEGVRACTEALADPVLEPFWERKVSILYARARHKLDANDPAGALADLAASRAVTAGKTPDVLFTRSLGVSTQMFEATLLAKEGKLDEARRLAAQAAEARPWSPIVQTRALSYALGEASPTAESQRIGERLSRLDSSMASAPALYLDRTNDAAAAAAAWDGTLAAGAETPTFEALMGEKEPPARPTKLDPFILSQAALAFARAGQFEKAQALLDGATLKPLIPDPGPPPPETADGAPAAGQSRQQLQDAAAARQNEAALRRLEDRARSLFPLTQAILAEGRGDTAVAVSYVQRSFADMPERMAAAELVRRLAARPDTAAQVPAFMVDAIAKKARPPADEFFKNTDAKAVLEDLPPLQSLGRGQRYRRPDGVRVVGELREQPLSNRPTGLQLTYSGGADKFAGDEMLYLRAGELAKEKGKSGFIVLRQNSRFLYRTGNPNYPTFPIPAEIEVDFVDVDAPPPELTGARARFIRADDVIAALKPIYIDLPAELDAARRKRR